MKIINAFIIFCSMLLFSSCIDEQVIVDNTPKPQGKIVINSEPSGAQIFFLGTDTKKVTPDSIIDLESGTFDVTLRLNGYRDTTFLVTVLNNHTATKNIELNELQVGSIYVDSDPKGARIYLAGEYKNKVTPDSLVNIDPGIYSLSLKLAGFRDTAFNVTVQNKIKAQMNVFLRDTLPELEAAIEYNFIQFEQMLFTFQFNRDIQLDQIVCRAPGAADSTVADFDNENVAEGEQRIVIVNRRDKGIWTFKIMGTKTEGDKRQFILYEEKLVR